ncbi:MAG: FkbM family methyltransferase [Patescibacteria group bacterium]|nr:FkbM family methyltransferase [Patescibacteria group bacterium]
MKKTLANVYIYCIARLFKWGTRIFGRRGLYKVWPFGMVYDLLSGALHAHKWPEVIDVDGHAIYAPEAERSVVAMWKGRADELEFRLLEREIPKGGTVIDVGANIGYYALILARAVGSEGRVFAFEPEKENIRFLKKNIEENHYGNVEIVSAAVGEKKSSVMLFTSNSNPGGHQIYDFAGRLKEKIAQGKNLNESEIQALHEHEMEMQRGYDVDVVSLDEYFKNYTRPIHLIKIDVEGAEGGVLAGMRHTLRKNPNIKLFFEFWPVGMRTFGSDPRAFLNILENEGFDFYDLNNFKRYKNESEKMDAAELFSRYENSQSTNVFAIKHER